MGRKIIIGLLIVGVGWVAFKLFYDPYAVYVCSPITDDDRCITILDHPDNLRLVYIIPGRWESSTPPSSNYILVKSSDEGGFGINWTKEKYRFTYLIEPIENKLDTSEVNFDRDLSEAELAKNEDGSYKSSFPQIEIYFMDEILRGTYKKIRKVGGRGEFYKGPDWMREKEKE